MTADKADTFNSTSNMIVGAGLGLLVIIIAAMVIATIWVERPRKRRKKESRQHLDLGAREETPPGE